MQRGSTLGRNVRFFFRFLNFFVPFFIITVSIIVSIEKLN